MKKLLVIFVAVMLMTSCHDMRINHITGNGQGPLGPLVERPLVVKRITKSIYDGYAVYEIEDGYSADHGVIILTDTIGRFNVGDKLDLIRK